MSHDSIENTVGRIHRFQTYKTGWHHGQGKAPEAEIVDISLRINSEMPKLGFAKTNAFLGIRGEIRITAYDESVYIELTVETNRTITLLFEKNDEEIAYEENLQLLDAFKRIRVLKWIAKDLLGFSIEISTIQTAVALTQLTLGHPLTVVEYPYLTKSALRVQATESANILKPITKTTQTNRIYSGSSTLKYSLLNASSFNKTAAAVTNVITTW